MAQKTGNRNAAPNGDDWEIHLKPGRHIEKKYHYPERLFYELEITGITFPHWWRRMLWHQLIVCPVDMVAMGVILFQTLSMSAITGLALFFAIWLFYLWKIRPIIVTPLAHFVNWCLGVKPRIRMA
jgi:hypothetical protein